MTQSVKYLNRGVVGNTTSYPYPEIFTNDTANGYSAKLYLSNVFSGENAIPFYLSHGITSKWQLSPVEAMDGDYLFTTKLAANGGEAVLDIYLPPFTRLYVYGGSFNFRIMGIEYSAE